MAAVIHNQTADKGATYTLSVRYKDSDGNPIDLSEHTATFLLLKRSESIDVIDQHAATTTADGWIHVVVPDEATAEWPNGTHVYRVVLDNGGAPVFPVTGTFKVRSPADV